MKKLLISGCFFAGALACLWLFQRGQAPGPTSGASIEGYYTEAPTQPRRDDPPQSEDREFRKSKAASNELLIAYQTLARSTLLPDGSVDPSGRKLPKEFAEYFENENRGHDQFVAGLPADGVATFKTFWGAVEILGKAHFIEFVAKNSESEKPSTFDFVIYSSVRDLVHEYPAMNEVARSFIARQWNLLSQSSNPVFRFLAIERTHRVIKDKAVALALLDARTSEVDPVIVHALIDQLAVIGGDSAKVALTRISDNARERRDQAVSKAADDAIAKLK